jgi:hypothetical protein
MESKDNSRTNDPVPKANTQRGIIREGNFLKNREDGEKAELDIQEMIDKSKCADIYHKLEECLGENDREWRKCQIEVKLLKDCNSK